MAFSRPSSVVSLRVRMVRVLKSGVSVSPSGMQRRDRDPVCHFAPTLTKDRINDRPGNRKALVSQAGLQMVEGAHSHPECRVGP
jgi:hypothetical protein